MDTMKIDMFLGQSESKGQIDGEIQIPVEKGDIEKIYNVCCIVNVREKSVDDDVIHLSGDAEFSIYYLTSQNGVDSFSAISPFSHDIEAKGARSDNQIALSYKVEDASGVILDPRSIRAAATICFTADLCESSILPDLDTASLETRRVPVDSKYKAGSINHPFHTTSELRIPGGMDQIENIIGTRCYGVINGIKADGQNAICFGDMFLDTLYSSGDDLWQICDSFPFEETIECDMNLEGKEIIGCISVKKASASAYDPDVITYSVSALIKLDLMGALPLGMVVDAYSLTHKIETVKSHINMKSPIQSENAKYTYRSTAKAGDIEKPLCIMATPIIKDQYAMEGSIAVEGSLVCDIMHQKDGGHLDCMRITLPIDENIPAPGVRENHDVRVCVNAQKASAIISGDEMEIRCPMDIAIEAFSAEEYDIIQSASEKEPLNRDGSSIMIYFKDEDEDVFDIAKNYHVASNDIIADNDKKLILVNPTTN